MSDILRGILPDIPPGIAGPRVTIRSAPDGMGCFRAAAEQYAVKSGQHPRITTETNIANFTRQIKSLGSSYDWSREVATTDPGNTFRWTNGSFCSCTMFGSIHDPTGRNRFPRW